MASDEEREGREAHQEGGGEDGGGITHDMIARRAHEISESDERGSDEENWLRAERELRGG